MSDIKTTTKPEIGYSPATDKEIIDCGISKVELEDVHDLMKYSEWKRASDHEIPPVQGVIGGNVRLDSNMDEV